MEPPRSGQNTSPPLIPPSREWVSIEFHTSNKINRLKRLLQKKDYFAQKLELAEKLKELNPKPTAEPTDLRKYEVIIRKNEKLFLARLYNEILGKNPKDQKHPHFPIDETLLEVEKAWRKWKIPLEISLLADYDEKVRTLPEKIAKEIKSLNNNLDTLAVKYDKETVSKLTNPALVKAVKSRILEKKYETLSGKIIKKIRSNNPADWLRYLETQKSIVAEIDTASKPIVTNFAQFLNKIPGAVSPEAQLLPLIKRSPAYAAHLLETFPADLVDAARDYLMDIKALSPTEFAAFANACVLNEGLKILRDSDKISNFLRGSSLPEAIPAAFQRLYLSPIFNFNNWTSIFLTCLSPNSMEIDPQKLPQDNEATLQTNRNRILGKTEFALKKIKDIIGSNRDVIPRELKNMYQTLWTVLEPTAFTLPNVQRIQLASLFFLRFFNTGLTTPTPPHEAIQLRDAVNMAKILQTVVTSQTPEVPYMRFLAEWDGKNPSFIEKNQPTINDITTLLRE